MIPHSKTKNSDRFRALGIGLLCVLVLAPDVWGNSDLKDQQAIETRQAIFKVMEWQMKPMALFLRKRGELSAAEIAERAETISVLASQISKIYTQSTGASALESRSKASIWNNMEDFKGRAEDLKIASESLAKAAKNEAAGDLRKGIVAVAKACKACHNDYRQD